MRTARWLLLAAILIIAAATGYVYLTQKKAAADSAPKPAIPLAAGVEGTAKEWHFTNSNGGCPSLQVLAKNFRQIREPSTGELDDVDLRLFHNCGKTFDHVKAAFFFDVPRPPTRAIVFPRVDRAGTRPATDTRVILVV